MHKEVEKKKKELAKKLSGNFEHSPFARKYKKTMHERRENEKLEVKKHMARSEANIERNAHKHSRMY